jgi:hypothetical protein
MNFLYKILILYFSFCSVSHAYIDPGSGMLFLQGILALIGIIIAFIKNPFTSIKEFIRRIREKK